MRNQLELNPELTNPTLTLATQTEMAHWQELDSASTLLVLQSCGISSTGRIACTARWLRDLVRSHAANLFPNTLGSETVVDMLTGGNTMQLHRLQVSQTVRSEKSPGAVTGGCGTRISQTPRSWLLVQRS